MQKLSVASSTVQGGGKRRGGIGHCASIAAPDSLRGSLVRFELTPLALAAPAGSLPLPQHFPTAGRGSVPSQKCSIDGRFFRQFAPHITIPSKADTASHRSYVRHVPPKELGRDHRHVRLALKSGLLADIAWRRLPQIVNPAFARPSAIRRTSFSFLNGCRAKCSLKEYFGLISLSSLQMRRASSPSPR
jgi:hypothetical protein